MDLEEEAALVSAAPVNKHGLKVTAAAAGTRGASVRVDIEPPSLAKRVGDKTAAPL